MAQICAMLAAMGASINGIREGMEANTSRMEQTMREEMQNMGAGLQDGLERLKIGNGELRWATYWGRRVEVTEKVTETVTRTLKGEETTCTRHIETRETMSEVTELTETREITREVVERLHGVKGDEDAHTHTHTGSEGQWGRARRAC